MFFTCFLCASLASKALWCWWCGCCKQVAWPWSLAAGHPTITELSRVPHPTIMTYGFPWQIWKSPRCKGSSHCPRMVNHPSMEFVFWILRFLKFWALALFHLVSIESPILWCLMFFFRISCGSIHTWHILACSLSFSTSWSWTTMSYRCSSFFWGPELGGVPLHCWRASRAPRAESAAGRPRKVSSQQGLD